MSVFKALDRSNVFLTDYVARKHWSIVPSEESLYRYRIQTIRAWSGSLPYCPNVEDRLPIYSSASEEGYYYPTLAYESLKQLYYGSTASFDTAVQSTITIPGSRTLPTESYRTDKDPSTLVVDYSIPRNIFGSAIQEGSVEFFIDSSSLGYIEDGYIEDGYFERTDIDPILIVDKEGSLVMEHGFSGYWLSGSQIIPSPVSGSTPLNTSGSLVGDVIYNQGMIIFTEPYATYLASSHRFEQMKWVSNKEIHTLNVKCVLEDSEFNYTLNPTAKPFVGDDNFTPYITSVGLYDEFGNLLAIAKLSKPLKKLDNIVTTIVLRIDLN